jgi:acyl-CoA hydrolase
VAQLRGKSARQRAQALIVIAHPDFRGWLGEETCKMCLF